MNIFNLDCGTCLASIFVFGGRSASNSPRHPSLDSRDRSKMSINLRRARSGGIINKKARGCGGPGTSWSRLSGEGALGRIGLLDYADVGALEARVTDPTIFM